MGWIDYVREVAGQDAPQTEIARAAKVTGPTVSRWLSGGQGVAPEAAAEFARHYRRPVLEAFVAAGFLTAEEAKARPAAAPDYTKLSNDQLIELLRGRLVEPAAAAGRVTEGAVEGERASERPGGTLHDLRKAPRVDVVFADTSVLVNEFLKRAGGDVEEAIRMFALDRVVRGQTDEETWLQTMAELNRQLAELDRGTASSGHVAGRAARKSAKRPPKGPSEQRGD